MPTKSISNRLNSGKSTGPENTNSTRFNATKHGLLAAGVTELDDAEGYRSTLHELVKEKDPLGQVETFLVRCAALDMIRWRRAGRLEAEYVTEELNPPIFEPGPVEETWIVDPGLPASMRCGRVELLVSTFQRYETAIANRLFRTLHELERLQRMRRGERLPAPVTVDVNVHGDSQSLDSFAKSATENVVEGSQSTLVDKETEKINESLRNG
jgi:hypothetical protein